MVKWLMRILALAMVFVLMFGTVSAFAAIKGSTDDASFCLETGKKSATLKFKASKGAYETYKWKWKWNDPTYYVRQSGKVYGTYTITATPLSGSGKAKSVKMTGSSKTLTLDKNTFYRVEIKYKPLTSKGEGLFSNMNYKDFSWITEPAWQLSSYKNVARFR